MNLRKVAISALSAVAALTIGIISLLPTTPSQARSASALLIKRISYVHEGKLTGPVDILLEDGRVAKISAVKQRNDNEELTNEENSGERQVLDGSNLVAIAGLIDAHTHSYGSALEDGLKFGVTATLDMASHVGHLEEMTDGRDDYKPTDRSDLYTAGMAATAPGGHGTQFGMPIDALEAGDDIEEWVSARIEEGSDYIKIIYMPYQNWAPSIDLNIAQAVIDTAHRKGKKAVAHIHSQQGALELMEAGIDGFVHMFADSIVTPTFIQMAQEKRVFFVPTLAVLASASGRHAGNELEQDPTLSEFLSPGQKLQLARKFDQAIASIRWQTAFENTARLAAAGIPMLAGSDAPNPGTTAGASLHHEMSLLAEAGLTNADVLASATTLPATHFNLVGRGSIDPGSRADLVILNTNPLQDIGHTRDIRWIIKNGQIIDRQ